MFAADGTAIDGIPVWAAISAFRLLWVSIRSCASGTITTFIERATRSLEQTLVISSIHAVKSSACEYHCSNSKCSSSLAVRVAIASWSTAHAAESGASAAPTSADVSALAYSIDSRCASTSASPLTSFPSAVTSVSSARWTPCKFLTSTKLFPHRSSEASSFFSSVRCKASSASALNLWMASARTSNADRSWMPVARSTHIASSSAIRSVITAADAWASPTSTSARSRRA